MKVSFQTLASERWLIPSEWKIYRRFLNSLEDHVSGELLDLEQIIEREDDEEQRNLLIELNEDYYTDFLQFKAILLNSFFTASYALFEHHLTRLCQSAKRQRKTPFSVNDLKGSITERAKAYLTKLEIAFPSDTPEWNSINGYTATRNKIVHAGGVVKKEWNHFDYAKSSGIIEPSEVPPDSLEPPRYIKVTRKFCDDACDDFMNFLLKVDEAIHSDANPVESADSSGQPNNPVQVEKASIWGYLRAVDWTNKTARLERIVGKPVPLKFGDELAEDMRRFATEYAQIRGEGVISAADDEWVSVNVTSIEGDRDPYKPFDMEEFLAQPSKPFDFKALPQLPPDDDFDVDDFNRIIREGRNVGLGRKE